VYAGLDTLESSGAELTAEQLDQAAGGIAMAVALIVSAVYLSWWAANNP